MGIFGTNLYSAEGAGKGVDAAGMKGKVFVAGYDAEPAQVTLLKQGVINILVIQNPAEEGALASSTPTTTSRAQVLIKK